MLKKLREYGTKLWLLTSIITIIGLSGSYIVFAADADKTSKEVAGKEPVKAKALSW